MKFWNDMSWIFNFLLLLGLSNAMFWGSERGGDQCDAVLKEITFEDRATAVDDTPTRLQSTWLSQECELRAGPEYVIRKYTFFENGTFLLMRHHYAEESCSVATHTVTARGSIRLLSPSVLIPGAVETRYQLDTVHIVPLNRQVAHKLGHRVNVSCTPQPKWRPYVAQLVYEQPPSRRLSNPSWLTPRYNSLQSHHPVARNQRLDCLEVLGIDYEELRVLRVQKRPSGARFHTGVNERPKVELFLGSLPPNVHAKRTHKSTFLQANALLRKDTITGCPVCTTILRGTESSPPLLHEVAALPALIGGSWLSTACESVEGGFWTKRQLQLFAGDKLWTGRWDYYADPRCVVFLYAVTAAGSYVQRASRHRRQNFVDHPNLEFHARRRRDSALEPKPRILKSIEDEEDQEGEVQVPSGRTSQILPKIPRSLNPQNLESKEPSSEEPRDRDWPSNLDARQTKGLAEWMTPELAREIFDLYAMHRGRQEEMLPTFEEIEEAIERSGNARIKRNLDDSYRHLLRDARPSMVESFAAMLRGNHNDPPPPAPSAPPRYSTTAKPVPSILTVPSGTTELDLHVAESRIIPGDGHTIDRCRPKESESIPLVSWRRNCVPRAFEAPSTLPLRARIGVNWNGEYILLLAHRDEHLWRSPLRQCGPTPARNADLRAHLRRSLGLRYGFFSSGATSSVPSWVFFGQVVVVALKFLMG